MQIQIVYDAEAKVWVGTCDKIGLALEDSSVEKLLQRIAEAAPEVMKLNGIFSTEEIYEELKEARDCYERGVYEDFDSALEEIRKKYGLTGEAQEICVGKLYELYLRMEKEDDENMCAMIEHITEFEEYVKQNDYTIWQRIHYDKMSQEELERFFIGKKSSNSDKKEMLEALKELDGCCKGFELTLEETRKRRLEEKFGDSVRKAVDMFSEDFMEDGRPEQIQEMGERTAYAASLEKKGIEKGIEKGKKIGQEKLVSLILRLQDEGRNDDAQRVLSDPVYREKLLAKESL